MKEADRAEGRRLLAEYKKSTAGKHEARNAYISTSSSSSVVALYESLRQYERAKWAYERYLHLSGEALLADPWRPIEEFQPPKNEREYAVGYTDEYGTRKWEKATYFPAFTLEDFSDSDPLDEDLYDEAEGKWYAPEGWYTENAYGDYEAISVPPTHFRVIEPPGEKA